MPKWKELKRFCDRDKWELYKDNEIQIEIMKRRARADKFKRFIASLENGQRFADEFDEDLWVGIVKEVVVKANDDLLFRLNDGQEIVG